jgi:biotin carboxyl carrier protein
MEQQAAAAPTDVPLARMLAGAARADAAPAEVLLRLVEVQCRVAPAESGAVLAIAAERRVAVLAVHPPLPAGQTAPLWLAQSVEAAPGLDASGSTHIVPVRRGATEGDGETPEHLVLIPLTGGGGAKAVASYLVRTGDEAVLDRARERLELTVGLLALYEMRLTVEARRHDLARLRAAMEVLGALNEHDRMRATAMALCNEIASRWGAERVALGFLRGRYVRTVAISHTERFDRKMRLVQDIEAAMEECLDQDIEIAHPPPEGSGFVCRAAAELSRRHGPTCVLSLPLRRGGEVAGVVTVETAIDRPPSVETAEMLRLTCDLCTPRLLELHDHDKWIGARAADMTRAGLAHLLGPRHTWTKLIAVLVVAFVLFCLLVKGPDRVDASFEITAVERRLVPAPFAGRIQAVEVEPGDVVEGGATVLATLDTIDLQLRLASARAERAGYLKEADLALRDGKQVEVQMAEANLRRVEADIRLLEHQVTQASLVAPITGTVVTGDLKRQIGAPVDTGDLLFEIAPLAALRAELEVPEDRIPDLLELGDLEAGAHHGTMASVAHPGDYIPFVIERINPVAEVIDQKNVFRVRVRLDERRDWLRPGMKGVAKVTVGRRPYGYLWTRKAVNWVRMKLWI